MKLHLPVKLRASVIAAILAVPAMLYNAFAGEHYTAPSDAFGWENNDIEFSTTAVIESAGNTYTAESHVKYATYTHAPSKVVGLIVEDGHDLVLDFDETNGYVYPATYPTDWHDTTKADQPHPLAGTPITPTGHLISSDTDTTRADIIVDTSNVKQTSQLAGATTFKSEGLVIKNSLVSAAANYQGDVNITTGVLEITNPNTTVVLEDVNINVADSTAVADDSQLVVLNGDKLTPEQATILGIENVSVNDVHGDAFINGVDLGAVGGYNSAIDSLTGAPVGYDPTLAGGSLAIVGNGKDTDSAKMDSVNLQGSLSLGYTDADIAGQVNAVDVLMVNSSADVTNDGGVKFEGLYVDKDSSLVAEGNVTNFLKSGAGFVDVAGVVKSTEGNISFSNGKVSEEPYINLGVKEGAVIDAAKKITLLSIDSVKAAKIAAGTDLTLVSGSTIQGLKKTDGKTDDITVGGNLLVGDGSSISDAEISKVGGDVIISDDAPGLSVGSLDSSSITNTDITVIPDSTLNGGASDITVEGASSMTGSTITDADGNVTIKEGSTITGSAIANKADSTDDISHDVVIDASTVKGSSITGVDGSASITSGSSVTSSSIGLVPNTGAGAAPSTVTVADSTVSNSHITGGNGDISISNSTVDAKGDIMTGMSPNATTNFIGTGKEGLGKILSAAGKDAAATEEKMLTSDSLNAKGFNVGSSIENTSGAVTVTDSDVSATLITGGGSVTIDDTDTPATEAAKAIEDAKAILAKAIADAEANGSAVVVPYLGAEGINELFGTVVDGSIIDVRGNLKDDPLAVNDLTVSQAALTNSVVLGVTGKIKVEDSVLGNDYIDGGAGFEIDNSVIIDTDVVNMTADIVLKDNSSFISTDPKKPFVINTLGNYADKDYDEYTGGSIILMDVDLKNGTIKSGVEAKPVVDAEGNITSWEFKPVTSASLAQKWDGANLVPVDGVTTLPYGQIKAVNATLDDMSITTAAGDISLDNTKVTDSGIAATLGAGNISITNKSEVDNTSVSAAGAGNITIADSTITDSVLYEEDADGNATAHSQSISTGGAGNIAITNSTVTDTDVTTGGAGNITITDSTVAVAGPALLPGTTPVARKEVSTGGAGDIAITGSTITHIDVANSTAIAEADKATLGNGKVDIAASTVTDSSVYTGTGNISITDSAIATSTVTSEGAGNVTLTGKPATGLNLSSVTARDSVNRNYLSNRTSFTLPKGMVGLGVPANATEIKGMSIVSGGTQSLTGLVMTIMKGSEVIATSEPIDFTGNVDDVLTFKFVDGSKIDLNDTSYKVQFNQDVDIRVIELTADSNVAAGMYGNWNAIVTTDYIAPGPYEAGVSLSAITQPTDKDWKPTNTVADSAISTGAGNIKITATKVTDSTVTNAGDGDITISNSAILGSETTDGSFTTAITTAGKGNIKVTDSVTDKATITTGEGNITMVGTLPVSEISYSSTAPYTSKQSAVKETTRSSVKFTNGLEGIGVPRDAVSVSKVSIELKNLGAGASGDKTVTFELKKNGVTLGTATVTLTEELRKNGGILTIDFGQDIAVNPTDKDYSLVFDKTIAMKTVVLTDGSKPADAGTDPQNAIVTMDYKAPIRDLDDAPAGSILSNVVADSLIQSEGDGNITITRTDMDNSTVLTGKGDTTITASDIRMSDIDSAAAGKITIKGSYVEDSTVTSGEGTNLATITIADSDIIRTGVKAAAAGVDNTITNSYVEDSVVYSGGGNMTIRTSEVLGSDVETADGGMFVRGESTIDSMGADTTYDKSTLTATDDSKVLEGSYVSGTNISITDTDNDGVAPDLTVEGTTADGLTPPPSQVM